MKKIKVPVVWSMVGNYEIEVEDDFKLDGHNYDEFMQRLYPLPLPTDGEYLEDSLEIDTDYENIGK
jgi:hypothetical protein